LKQLLFLIAVVFKLYYFSNTFLTSIIFSKFLLNCVRITKDPYICFKGDHFQFSSVFIKKKYPNRIFKKKLKPVQTNQFQFGLVWPGFSGQKPVQTGLALFFGLV
jgi:hypothetical protein